MPLKNLIILLIYSNFCLTLTTAHKIYYIESRKSLSWPAARDECKAKGMNLLSIKTKKESQYLNEYIRDYIKDTKSDYWCGGHMLRGDFVWAANGEKIKTFFWQTNEPNNQQGDEYCIQLYNNFEWNDNNCDLKFPFICDLEV